MQGQLPFWTGVPICQARQLVSRNRLALEWLLRLRLQAGRILHDTAAAFFIFIFSRFLLENESLRLGA